MSKSICLAMPDSILSLARLFKRSWLMVDLRWFVMSLSLLKLLSADATVAGSVRNILKLIQRLGNILYSLCSAKVFNSSKNTLSPKMPAEKAHSQRSIRHRAHVYCTVLICISQTISRPHSLCIYYVGINNSNFLVTVNCCIHFIQYVGPCVLTIDISWAPLENYWLPFLLTDGPA